MYSEQNRRRWSLWKGPLAFRNYICCGNFWCCFWAAAFFLIGLHCSMQLSAFRRLSHASASHPPYSVGYSFPELPHNSLVHAMWRLSDAELPPAPSTTCLQRHTFINGIGASDSHWNTYGCHADGRFHPRPLIGHLSLLKYLILKIMTSDENILMLYRNILSFLIQCRIPTGKRLFTRRAFHSLFIIDIKFIYWDDLLFHCQLIPLTSVHNRPYLIRSLKNEDG